MAKKILAIILTVAFVFSLPFWAIPYQVTFEDETGAKIWPDEKYYYWEDTVLPDAKKENYNFLGWYSKDGSAIGTHILSSKALVAKFIPKTFQIRYLTDDGVTPPEEDEYKYGESLKLPEAEKTHYIFNGWQETHSDTGVPMRGRVVTVIKPTDSGDKVFSAVFTPETYSISYELNGGSSGKSHPETYTYGSKPDISNPSRSGYEFTGWYLDKELTRKYSFSETDTYGDMTLYAGWSKITVPSFSNASSSTTSGGVRAGCYVGYYYAPLTYASFSSDYNYLCSVVNSGSALYSNLSGGVAYIADHCNQGFIASVQYNTLKIVHSDGRVETFYKNSTHYSTQQYNWDCTDGINVYYDAYRYCSLVTQTCVTYQGRRCLAFCFWSRG